MFGLLSRKLVPAHEVHGGVSSYTCRALRSSLAPGIFGYPPLAGSTSSSLGPPVLVNGRLGLVPYL